MCIKIWTNSFQISPEMFPSTKLGRRTGHRHPQTPRRRPAKFILLKWFWFLRYSTPHSQRKLVRNIRNHNIRAVIHAGMHRRRPNPPSATPDQQKSTSTPQLQSIDSKIRVYIKSNRFWSPLHLPPFGEQIFRKHEESWHSGTYTCRYASAAPKSSILRTSRIEKRIHMAVSLSRRPRVGNSMSRRVQNSSINPCIIARFDLVWISGFGLSCGLSIWLRHHYSLGNSRDCCSTTLGWK